MRISDWSSDVCSSDLCGGNSAFFHHSRDARFEALVTQPQASAGSRSVARSDVPTGVYILNALPFTVLPETLSIIQLTKPWRELPRSIDFSECGTFVPRGSELWSFVPLPIRSEEHTSELQSLMRISYAVFCLKKKK